MHRRKVSYTVRLQNVLYTFWPILDQPSVCEFTLYQPPRRDSGHSWRPVQKLLPERQQVKQEVRPFYCLIAFASLVYISKFLPAAESHVQPAWRNWCRRSPGCHTCTSPTWQCSLCRSLTQTHSLCSPTETRKWFHFTNRNNENTSRNINEKHQLTRNFFRSL